MSLTIKETKSYLHDPETVYVAAKGAVQGLEGTILEDHPSDYKVVAKFPKTILGKVLGDRAWMQVEISADESNSSNLDLTAYPLNAIEQKLMFGARKGALRTLLTWFYAHLDHRLPKD